MGRDKADVVLAGKTLLEHALDNARTWGGRRIWWRVRPGPSPRAETCPIRRRDPNSLVGLCRQRPVQSWDCSSAPATCPLSAGRQWSCCGPFVMRAERCSAGNSACSRYRDCIPAGLCRSLKPCWPRTAIIWPICWTGWNRRWPMRQWWIPGRELFQHQLARRPGRTSVGAAQERSYRTARPELTYLGGFAMEYKIIGSVMPVVELTSGWGTGSLRSPEP